MATVTLTPTLYTRKNHLSLKSNQKRENIIDTSGAIATYYIPFLLRASISQESLRGLPKHYLVPPQNPTDLFLCVSKMCTQMESENERFFKGLPENLKLKPENAKELFFTVSKEVLTNKINWGRIVSIYTLAGVFAVYLAKNGYLSTVQKIPRWIEAFTDDELADWIIEEGGWDTCQTKLSNTGAGWSKVLAFGGVCAAAGYILFSGGLGR